MPSVGEDGDEVHQEKDLTMWHLVSTLDMNLQTDCAYHHENLYSLVGWLKMYTRSSSFG